MEDERKENTGKNKEKHYKDDIFIEHKFCRSCVNFARPSLPILSSWGKCQKGMVKGWCRDFFPACELYSERTENQKLFEQIVLAGVVILVIFVLIQGFIIFSYLLSHPGLQLPPEQQRHWNGFFGIFRQ